MRALQQGRAVFNPLPLAEYQSPDLIPRFQDTAKAAHERLITLAGSIPSTDMQEDQEELRSLINLLNIQKNLGLWWNEDLEKKTLDYWEDKVKASKFS